MVFMRSQVFWGVFVTAFVVLPCVDLACRVEGDIILRLANIGDDIALGCSRSNGTVDNYKWWYRNGTLLANWDGFVISDPRFTQGNSDIDDGFADSNNIYISNIRFSDSATFKCLDYYNNTLQSYDLRVIRCYNCITASHSNPDKVRVICTLDNYWTRQVLLQNILLKGNIYRRAVIQGNTFSFSIYLSELSRLHSEFRLRFETESMITCKLSTQPTLPSSPTTTLPTTSLKQTTQNRPSTLSYTASKTLPVGRPTSMFTTKHHTPKNKHAKSDKRTTMLSRTSLKQTTQNTPSTLPYTASKRLPVGRPISPNTNSDKNKRDGNITMIVVILGSAFILILMVIIIILRRKQMRDRQENKHIPNASIKQEHPEVCYESVEDGSLQGPEYATSITKLRETSLDQRSADHADKKEHPEVYYESVKDGSLKGPKYAISIKELRKSILDQRSADHADKKEHLEVCYESVGNVSQNGPEYASSIKELRETSLDQQSADYADKKEHLEVYYESVADGSRKGPEYATSIVELRKTKSESKSTNKLVTGGSSKSDHLYENSVIIPQHELSRDTLQQEDHYENVKITGSGDDAEEIQLYDMSHKGPTMNF